MAWSGLVSFLPILPPTPQDPFLSSLTITWWNLGLFSQKAEKKTKSKTMPIFTPWCNFHTQAMSGWSELLLCSRELQDVLSGGREGGSWGGCWKEDVTVSHSFANGAKGRERLAIDLDTRKRRLLMSLSACLCKTRSLSESSTWKQSGWAWVLALLEEMNRQRIWGNF